MMSYEVTDNGESRTGIPIKRITWEDGQWWEVLAMMPDRVEAAIRTAMSSIAKVKITKDTVDAEPDTDIIAERWSIAANKARMARIKGCTVAWSWDFTVTEDAIGDMPPYRTKNVREVMDRLHVPDTERVSDDEKKSLSSPSSSANHSGAVGSLPSNT